MNASRDYARAATIIWPSLCRERTGDAGRGFVAPQPEYPEDGFLRAGSVEIDLVKRQVWVGGEPVQLLQTEFRLLEFLARHAGRTVARQVIFEQVWGRFFEASDNLINVHIAKLRKKLERPGHASPIQTIKGEGYRLDVD
jgi:two-component system OmpR family response regulator